MKTLVIVLGIIIVGMLAVLFAVPPKQEFQKSEGPVMPLGADPKNSTYLLEGALVTLADGRADNEGMKIRDFGNEALGDFNGDGTTDTVFLLTQDGGGSGTFFYAVVALKVPGGYQGTNAIFLGDRIAPQTTEFRAGEIIVNYAERKPGEPMTEQPSVGVSRYLEVRDGRLQEIRK